MKGLEGKNLERLRALILSFKTDVEDSCWLSTRHINPWGYSLVSVGGVTRGLHRVCYAIFKGELPSADIEVCHRCDVPNCVNPDHLFLGTPLDNATDKVAKDRQTRGERHALARLSERDILAIRSDTMSSAKNLADRYGVCDAYIYRIRSGKAWVSTIARIAAIKQAEGKPT
jgi:hypothetical protein